MQESTATCLLPRGMLKSTVAMFAINTILAVRDVCDSNDQSVTELANHTCTILILILTRIMVLSRLVRNSIVHVRRLSGQ
jgi:hypothetical protein